MFPAVSFGACLGRYPLYPILFVRGEMPSLPGPLARGDTLSTRSSSCAGRYPLYPILLVCGNALTTQPFPCTGRYPLYPILSVRGEMSSLPDCLRVRGDALSTPSSSCAGRCPLHPIRRLAIWFCPIQCPRCPPGRSCPRRSFTWAGFLFLESCVLWFVAGGAEARPAIGEGRDGESGLIRIGDYPLLAQLDKMRRKY